MPVKIRLMRIGATKRPFYRVVAVDERKKRTGSYLELLGTYNPLTQPKEIILKQDRIDDWIKKGAQLSTGFLRIIGKAPQRQPGKPKKGATARADKKASAESAKSAKPEEPADQPASESAESAKSEKTDTVKLTETTESTDAANQADQPTSEAADSADVAEPSDTADQADLAETPTPADKAESPTSEVADSAEPTETEAAPEAPAEADISEKGEKKE